MDNNMYSEKDSTRSVVFFFIRRKCVIFINQFGTMGSVMRKKLSIFMFILK